MSNLKECFRCEKEFSKSALFFHEGCFLCSRCLDLIEKNYEKEMEKEFGLSPYIIKPEPCKGCD
jgi:hypothetical protein